jgi:hypothetical protein
MLHEVPVYYPSIADYEDPEVATVRHCRDCQHFRKRSDWEGFCIITATFEPDLQHKTRGVNQLACDDILPIGYEFDFI